MCTTLLLLTLLGTSAKPATVADLGPLPPGTVRLFLIRHGQALTNLDPRPNLPAADLDHLTEWGRRQSSAAAALLRGQAVTLILTSPVGRARETAEVLKNDLDATQVRIEPRVRSLELGRSSAGKPLTWNEREAEWRAGRDAAPPGGESLRQLADRQLELVADLARERPGQAVVLVSHGEVIAALVGDLEGRPIASWQDEHVANGSITVVDAKAGERPRVLRWNVISP